MGFRSDKKQNVLVIESSVKSSFEKRLSEALAENKVADLQFSTRVVPTHCTSSGRLVRVEVWYSALIIVEE